MKRVIPLGFALFVAGGLLSGFLGLTSLTFALGRPPRPVVQTPRTTSLLPPESAPRINATPFATPVPLVNVAGASALGTTGDTAGRWSFLYVIGGDLWMADGSSQFQLTQGAQIGQPAFRDDTLAFVQRDRNASDIWLASADTPPRPITQNTSTVISQNHWATQPVFIPGKQQLFVLGDFNKDSTGPGNLAVWELSLQEKSVVQITRPPAYAGGDQDITVNPEDPRQIVFTRYAYNSTRLIEQLQWMDVTSKGLVALGQPDTPSRQASYSPDGSSIAFVQAGQGTAQDLWVAGLQVLTDGPQLVDSRLVVTGLIANPVWSPDGNELAYIGLAKDQFQLWTVTVNRNSSGGIESFGQPTQITSGPPVDAMSRPVYLTREQSLRVRDWLTMAPAHS